MLDTDFLERRTAFIESIKEKLDLDFSRPFLLYNKDFYDSAVTFIPDNILWGFDYEPHEYQHWVNSYNFFQKIFSFTREEEIRFKKGMLVVVSPKLKSSLPKRSTGGQALTPEQNSITNALSVAAFVSIERIRHLQTMDAEKETTLTISAVRGKIINTLAEGKWPKGDYRNKRKVKKPTVVQDTRAIKSNPSNKSSEIPEEILENRKKHLDTLLRNGQRPTYWQSLYPVANLLEAIPQWTTARFAHRSPAERTCQIEFEKATIVALLRCETAADQTLRAEAQMADRARADQTPTPQQLREASACSQECLFTDVLLAAFASEINPASIFHNLASRHRHFAAMANVGRLYRKLQIEPSIDSLAIDPENKKTLLCGLAFLQWWELAPPSPSNDAEREMQLWAMAMAMVCDSSMWERALA